MCVCEVQQPINSTLQCQENEAWSKDYGTLRGLWSLLDFQVALEILYWGVNALLPRTAQRCRWTRQRPGDSTLLAQATGFPRPSVYNKMTCCQRSAPSQSQIPVISEVRHLSRGTFATPHMCPDSWAVSTCCHSTHSQHIVVMSHRIKNLYSVFTIRGFHSKFFLKQHSSWQVSFNEGGT